MKRKPNTRTKTWKTSKAAHDEWTKMPHKLLSHTVWSAPSGCRPTRCIFFFAIVADECRMCNMQIKANGTKQKTKNQQNCMHACMRWKRVKYVLRCQCPRCQCATDSNAAQRQRSTSRTAKVIHLSDRHTMRWNRRSAMYLLLVSFRFVCSANRVRETTAIFGAIIFIGEKRWRVNFRGVSPRLPCGSCTSSSAHIYHNCRSSSRFRSRFACIYWGSKRDTAHCSSIPFGWTWFCAPND